MRFLSLETERIDLHAIKCPDKTVIFDLTEQRLSCLSGFHLRSEVHRLLLFAPFSSIKNQNYRFRRQLLRRRVVLDELAVYFDGAVNPGGIVFAQQTVAA